MKNQALFSSKDKSKKLKCRLLQFLCGALRVKVISSCCFVFLFTENEAEGELKFTPWFRLISQRFLFKWWNNLDKMKTLQDHKIIHKLS